LIEEAPVGRVRLSPTPLHEAKGHAHHEAEDLRYVYIPVVPQSKARRGALRHLVDTFFSGSAAQAAAALLDSNSASLFTEDLDRLSSIIEKARREGK
jgi:predicted transcriptional regulator